MRVGIIGTGFIADVHAAALRAAGQDIVAICGNEEAVLASFAKKWSIASSYADYRDIPLEILDAVHICTPPNTHYTIAKYFLEKNLTHNTENINGSDDNRGTSNDCAGTMKKVCVLE